MVCSCKSEFCYGCSEPQNRCACSKKGNNRLDIYPKMQHYYKPRNKSMSKKAEIVPTKVALKPTVFLIPF